MMLRKEVVRMGTGRPKKSIPIEQFEKLCFMQATEAEICDFFGVTDKTLTRWCKDTYGKSFSEIFAQRGKISAFLYLHMAAPTIF